ncbi:MAG: MATE family efflux transporter [Gaiellales bacterium]
MSRRASDRADPARQERALSLRSPYDRRILALALPALGALAAEPLYVLVDTAIVGHLGREPLAALGIAAAVLAGLFALFNFLAYSTTAQVARASGAGESATALRLGAQALWLSLGIGVVLTGLTIGLAEPAVGLFGADGETADLAVTYLRIAALGLPFGFVALGGQGYLRGVADLRFPLVVLVAGNVLNAILEVVFVYGFGWGIEGSAWGTVIAQAAMGSAFVIRIVSSVAGELRPRIDTALVLLRLGRHIFVRTAALYGALLVASAVAARIGPDAIAGHQVVVSLWFFLALVLDAVAIAGQVLVGQALGAGDAHEAFAAGKRMIVLSVAAGGLLAAVLVGLADLLPHAFADDPTVLDQVALVWLVFALMQPLGGAAFALDGILIGAGDGRYLMWSMVAAFAVSAGLSLATLAAGWSLLGVWLAVLALLAVRVALLGVRFAQGRWQVTGWGDGPAAVS